MQATFFFFNKICLFSLYTHSMCPSALFKMSYYEETIFNPRTEFNKATLPSHDSLQQSCSQSLNTATVFEPAWTSVWWLYLCYDLCYFRKQETKDSIYRKLESSLQHLWWLHLCYLHVKAKAQTNEVSKEHFMSEHFMIYLQFFGDWLVGYPCFIAYLLFKLINVNVLLFHIFSHFT